MINCNLDLNTIIGLSVIILIIVILFNSKKQENFDMEKDVFTRNVITEEASRNIKDIIRFILGRVGPNFRYINHEDILVTRFDNNFIRYRLNIFLSNTKDHTTRNVLMDILKGCNKIKILSIKRGNSLNILKKNPESTSNVVKYVNDCHDTMGFGETSLDYSKLEGDNLPNIHYKYTDTIRPDRLRVEMKAQNSQFPCRNLSKFWDKNGVKTPEDHTKCCMGINSATKDRELVASFNPNIIDKRIKISDTETTEQKCLKNL